MAWIAFPFGFNPVLDGQAGHLPLASAQIPPASLLCDSDCAPSRVLVPVLQSSLCFSSPPSSVFLLFPQQREVHPPNLGICSLVMRPVITAQQHY